LDAIKYSLLCGSGILLATIGVTARRFLDHYGRAATLCVIIVGLLTMFLSLYFLGSPGCWSDAWGGVSTGYFGAPPPEQMIPLPRVALPFAAIIVALLGARFQLPIFVYMALAALSFSIHMLGFQYLHDTQHWPATVMITGLVALVVALIVELRRTRGNALDDMPSSMRL
jgi:hypothetical protein